MRFAVGGAVLDGVVDEVGERLAQHQAIAEAPALPTA